MRKSTKSRKKKDTEGNCWKMLCSNIKHKDKAL